FQGLGVHDAQDWAEALVEVVPGTRLYVIANTRGPQGAFLIELFWLNQPLLAGIQLGQTAQQFIARWLNEAVHRGLYFKAGADCEATYGIEKLIAQAVRFAGCTDEDDEGGCRTLLSGVAKGRVVEIRDGEIRVCGWGNNQRVFARGLGREVHLWAPGAEQLTGIGSAGEDDIVHVLM